LNSNIARHLYPIALAHLVIELCNNYLPVVYPILITTMALSYAQVGIVTLVGSTAATLSQPLFGYLSDRLESRRVIMFSVLWIGLLMSLVGLVPSYGVLILLVGLGSLGSAAFHPAGATMAAGVTTTRRGATLSVFSVSGTLGSALSPLLIATVVTEWGLGGTLVLFPTALLAGLLLLRQWGWARNGVPSSRAPMRSGAHAPAPAQSGSLVGLVLVIFLVMFRSWFQFSLATYLPEWLRSQGWPLTTSGRMLTAFLVSVSLGAVIGGTLSDRVGRWQVVALSLGLLGPAYWFFVGASGTPQVKLVVVIGVLLGSSFPVTVAMAQEAWPQGIGLASALVMGLGWLPGGLGASFTGLVADQTSLAMALRLLVIPPILGLACALIYARYQQMADHPGRRQA
jgi:FSR family fosmidomycin resistance protein-like MFS transporter